MVKYSVSVEEGSAVCAKARKDSARVHYKKAREVGAAIKGMKVTRAISYLNHVLEKKEGVAFRRHTGGCGRHAQGKNVNAPGNAIGWPVIATKAFLDLLTNAVASATFEDKHEESNLTVSHVCVQRAPKMRRRTYRAHGRINAYMRSPAHIELFLSDQTEEHTESADRSTVKPLSLRRRAQLRRLPNGASAAAQ